MNDTIVREQHGGMFEFNGLGRELEAIQHGPPMQQQQQHPSHIHGAEWSGDFMAQHSTAVAGPSEGQFDHFEDAYRQSHSGPSAQQQHDNGQHIHPQYQPHQQYVPQRNMFHRQIQGGGPLHGQYSSPMVTSKDIALENEQFERAFEAANKGKS